MTEPIAPKECRDMATLRKQIDRLDRQLVDLLHQRAGYIEQATALKSENGWPARIPERMEEVVENAKAAAAEKGMDVDMIETLWRQLVEWSIAREAEVIRED